MGGEVTGFEAVNDAFMLFETKKHETHTYCERTGREVGLRNS
jgi:hypothetical protein